MSDNELNQPPGSVPDEDQVLRAIYESELHQYCPNVLLTNWKDGIDIDEPSHYIMGFVRKLYAQNNKVRDASPHRNNNTEG